MPIEYKDPETGASIFVPTEEEKLSLEAQKLLKNVPTELESMKNTVSNTEVKINNVTEELNNKVGVEFVNAELAKKPTYLDLNKKADTSYVDTKVNAVTSGSPKGVFANLTALQANKPGGDTGIYVVQSDGKWYYWNGSSWVAGGVYQGTTVADGSITPSKVDKSFYDDLLIRNTISVMETNTTNLMSVFDGTVSLSDIGKYSNPNYYTSVSYGSGKVSFIGSDLEVKNDATNGYTFYKVKAINDLSPNKKISALLKVKSGTVGAGSNNQLHLRFTNSSGANTASGAYTYLNEIGGGYYGVIGAQVPSDASFIEFRIDNRKASPGGDILVSNITMVPGEFVGKYDDSAKKDIKDLEQLTVVDLFPDPLFKGLEWVNYVPYPSKTVYTAGSLNGKRVVTVYGATDDVLSIIGHEQKLGYLSVGDTVNVSISVEDIIKTASTHTFILVFLNNKGAELSRVTQAIGSKGVFTFKNEIPANTDSIRVRIDVKGEKTNLVSLSGISIKKEETMQERKPVTVDIYTVQNMIKQSSNSGGVVYVSTTGDDSNTGKTAGESYATLGRALLAKASTIIMERGDYYNQGDLQALDMETLSILPSNHGTFDSSTRPDAKKVRIFGSDLLTGWSSYNRIFKKPYSGNQSFIDVFITRTVPPDTGGTRPSYNATIWENSNRINDVKLKPVLTLAECESTEGSFFYDGTDVYINPTGGTLVGKEFQAVKLTVGLNFQKVNNLLMQDIVLSCFTTYPMYLRNIENMQLQNCEATHSVKSDGFSLNNSNGQLIGCEAYKNRNDGFNIHEYGDTVFVNCSGYHNYDDGISHHDGTTGAILGGDWYNNGKGGIIPTYGSKVNVSNANCWGNIYGVAVMASATDKRRKVTVRNVNCYNNTHGIIFTSNYDGYVLDCTVRDNTNGLTVSDGAKVEVINLLSTDNKDCGIRIDGANSNVIVSDSRISDNVRGLLMDSANGTIQLSRNQLLYNTIGVEHGNSSGTLTVIKRNNLYGNTTDWVGSTPSIEKSKNVSIPAI